MDLNRWAENLQREVYNEWKTKYSFWKSGFKVFYSPAKMNPQLMIISYQPGGDASSFEKDKRRFEAGNFSVQKYNSYVERSHHMSKKVRDFFSMNANLLGDSVIFPLIFFRASNIRRWKKLGKETRLQMESLCLNKVKEIIEVLNPHEILVLGIETYDKLKGLLGETKNETILRTRLHTRRGKESVNRMVLKSEIGNIRVIRVFGIMHPSGSRIHKEDWEIMKRLFHSR